MAMTSVQLTHEVEKSIRNHLTEIRAANTQNYCISMLAMYSLMEKQFIGQNITAGFFNKIVADMRRAGIVDVCQGAWVQLSDDAWDMYRKNPRLLCVSKYDSASCNLPEGHSGPHANSLGKWYSEVQS